VSDKVILLVEDNASDVDLTRRALEKRRIGNELVVVGDGQEALDYLFAQGAYAHRDPTVLPTVVLLDINLPKIDGLSVLRRIRAHARTALLPVIMLTTSQEEQDLLSSYRLHANSYIRKPVDFLQFVDAVGQLGMYWLVLNEQAPAAR
jgi:CheY-like chemotaxis protein